MAVAVQELAVQRAVGRGRAVRLEGGLFGPDLLERLAAGDLPGQKPQDFGLRGRSLVDEVASAYRDARDMWKVFRRRVDRLPDEDPATSVTRDSWVIPFLELLGYELRYNPRAYDVGGISFAVSHRAGEGEDAPPVHIVGFRRELGRVDPTGRPRVSPHGLLQEFLNRSEHLWGIVTNGRQLRLLRKSPLLRRQAYVEFDREALCEEDRFAEFVLLYRLLHRSRLPRGIADAHECWLERYHQEAVAQGNRARDRLRDGVEECLLRLANGFLRRGWRPQSPEAFYRDILRLVYRFLFLLVAEERGLLSGSHLYRDHYSISRLRRLVDDRAACTEHDDLWLGLRALWHLLRDSTPVPQADGKPLASLLELPVLDGGLFEPMDLEGAAISNHDLLEAFRNLVYYYDEESRAWLRVNYAALDVEELGSVYESLLDNRPELIEKKGGLEFRFAAGTERRSTGSYYTPPELVGQLVESALEPVLKERLQTAKARVEREKAILGIKVVDPAAGSGHFLLAAARRLGKELARTRTGEDEPAPEAQREAVRDVITHCIYGVDKNPLAVELCKVALWIESHAPGKPLTFLDHRIKCGDSLVGVLDLDVLEKGIPDEAYDRANPALKRTVRALKDRNRQERAGQLRLDIHEALDSSLLEAALAVGDLERTPDDSAEAVAAKARRYSETQAKLDRHLLACHVWTAAFFWELGNPDAPTTDTLFRCLANPGAVDGRVVGRAQGIAHRHRFFHWPLEFPDVFVSGGFDVVLGNPPFMGGLRISGTLGDRYRQWLEIAFAPYGGTADLCAAFYRRAFGLLKPGGRMGMVATNTIGQGDTREGGLAVILQQGGVITMARRFLKWPGAANVEVNLVAIHKPRGDHQGRPYVAVLDGTPVDFISSRLDAEPEAEPRRLPQNEGKAFQGDIVRGIGFVLEPWEAQALLQKDPRNADCLFPYLNGEDLNSHPEQKPSRWVICLHDWNLERARQYPDLLRMVEERVKPDRERLRGPGDKRNREFWWQFGAYRSGLRAAIAPLRRVLGRALTSEHHAMAWMPLGIVYDQTVIVFAYDSDYHFAVMQSNVHELWVRTFGATLESRGRYNLGDCFDTFPFPLEEYRWLESGELKGKDGRPDYSLLIVRDPRFAQAARLGAECHEHRRQIMLARSLGLTKTYNLFHNPNCTDGDIVRLRELHAAMDRAVLACYGWDDIAPDHGFYANDRG